MDKFTTSQSGQSILNSKWKQEERKEGYRKFGHIIYSKKSPFLYYKLSLLVSYD